MTKALPLISMIAAEDRNRAIGKGNTIPWPFLKEDIDYFKKMTANKVVIMGHNTWKSLSDKFRPLPNRINVVIASNASLNPPGIHPDVIAVCDVQTALKVAMNTGGSTAFELDPSEIMVIGGASIYQQMMPFANRIYLTKLNSYAVEDPDTFFPEINPKEWTLSEITSIPGPDWCSTYSRQTWFNPPNHTRLA